MEISKFLLNGEWCSSERTTPVVGPQSPDPVGETYLASPKEIDSAIAGAASVFASTRRMAPYERADVLGQIARSIESNKERFARLITSETGKPISLSRVEVDRSILTFNVSASEAERIEGSVVPLDIASHSKGRTGIIRRFPLGPVAAITPFNFPLNLVAHKVGPAIASGNPVLLKPASSGMLTALALGRIISETILPRGALSILPCKGNEAHQLVTDERVKLLSFTGSPVVGWAMKSQAGKKKVVLELGGNAGVIVDEGVDPDRIVRRIAMGAFSNAGQSCIAVQRIFVHQSCYDQFESLFVAETMRMKVGDPSLEDTIVGPMISEEAAVKISDWIDEAKNLGARILCGGVRKGVYLEPTVLVNSKPQMKVCAEEVFAPVATLEPFGRFEDAVVMVNDSKYGLQAGVFTDSIENASYAFENLEVGGVIINDYPSYRIENMPYGGIKDSGFGREGVRWAIESMTEPKLMVSNSVRRTL